MSGVTQSVNNIVSGCNRSATVSTIKKLCDGWDITIEEFFDSELFQYLDQEFNKCKKPPAPVPKWYECRRSSVLC